MAEKYMRVSLCEQGENGVLVIRDVLWQGYCEDWHDKVVYIEPRAIRGYFLLVEELDEDITEVYHHWCYTEDRGKLKLIELKTEKYKPSKFQYRYGEEVCSIYNKYSVIDGSRLYGFVENDVARLYKDCFSVGYSAIYWYNGLNIIEIPCLSIGKEAGVFDENLDWVSIKYAIRDVGFLIGRNSGSLELVGIGDLYKIYEKGSEALNFEWGFTVKEFRSHNDGRYLKITNIEKEDIEKYIQEPYSRDESKSMVKKGTLRDYELQYPKPDYIYVKMKEVGSVDFPINKYGNKELMGKLRESIQENKVVCINSYVLRDPVIDSKDEKVYLLSKQRTKGIDILWLSVEPKFSYDGDIMYFTIVSKNAIRNFLGIEFKEDFGVFPNKDSAISGLNSLIEEINTRGNRVTIWSNPCNNYSICLREKYSLCFNKMGTFYLKHIEDKEDVSLVSLIIKESGGKSSFTVVINKEKGRVRKPEGSTKTLDVCIKVLLQLSVIKKLMKKVTYEYNVSVWNKTLEIQNLEKECFNCISFGKAVNYVEENTCMLGKDEVFIVDRLTDNGTIDRSIVFNRQGKVLKTMVGNRKGNIL